MNSRFKFPRRVRIHGGECGAVARALHHKVKINSLPAVKEKVSFTTNERKSMSTKTTLKRIALVAVSALGFGLLGNVVPAQAATASFNTSSLTVGTIPTAQVGVAHKTPITLTAAADALALGGSDTVQVSVRVTSAPTGSALRSLANLSKLADGTTAGTFLAATFATGNNVGASIGFTATSGGIVSTTHDLASDLMTVGTNFTTIPKTAAARTAGSMGALTVDITPDIAGTYVVLVSTSTTYTDNTTAVAAAYTAGDTNVSYTFTTGASVTAVALSAATGVSTEDTSTGQLIKVTLTGALGLNENIVITDNSSTSNFKLISARTSTTATTDGNTSSLTMTATHFSSGVGYFLINNTAAETVVITAAGGGLLSPSITSTLSTEFKTQYIPTLVTMSDTATNVAAGGQSGHVGYTAATDKASTAATSHTYTATVTAGTAGDYVSVSVLDSAGKASGVAGVTYTYAAAMGTTTTATISVSAACTSAGACFTATVDGTTDGVVAVTAEAPAQLTVAVTGSTGSTMRAGYGASSVLSVVLKDQFRVAVANSFVTIATTGRNASSANTTLNTDANGIVTYTRTDAGTEATANKQSVVTFTGGTAGSATVTINYTDSTLGVSAIELETPTSDDTVASGTTYTDINASSSSGATGPTTARTWTSITATVTDANGAVLSGIPVTFATTDAGAAVASTFATVYTGADGTAVSKVYGWTAGVKNFTATAGAKSDTGTVAFRQGGATGTDSPTEVRNITAVVSGNSIIVTAKDRFGNVVSGVPLFGTRTGNGTFGGGSNTNGQTTGVDGTAEFLFNAGTAASVVTITAGSTTAVAAACYGQTGNLAGKAVCSTAATQTAYTAYVAGTATTAEIGVGDTLSPAGNQSVSVNFAAGVNEAQVAAEAATDAAAEAIDAANAATDAANLAAEAADAATVAAEEARDAADAATAAVEELATQVATLMAALKAQITTLANTVAKIAKKVKA
jgi:hypothetical protein